MKKLTLLICFVCLFTISSVQAQEIKIVHFSDIHLDTKSPDKKVRKLAKSKPMFEKAINKVNQLNPDIVVFSGDMMNRSDAGEFDIFLKTVAKLKAPYYPVLGNHDVGVGGGLSKKAILSKLNTARPDLKLNNPSYYTVKGDYIFIFMDGTTDKIISANGYFHKETLAFLDKTLSNFPEKKAIIVQHFPLLEPIKSSTHMILNKNDYLAILDRHTNVILVLSGHYHMSKKFERNNVLHISTPSMIEYPHAFRYLKINDNKDGIIVESALYPDEEQNFAENVSADTANLKAGQKTDNFFKIKLIKSQVKTEYIINKKNFREIISCWFEKIALIIRNCIAA